LMPEMITSPINASGKRATKSSASWNRVIRTP
jgi:hypothetical protein